MRRKEKEISKEAAESLPAGCRVGRLGTIAKDGRPMIKPLNFAYSAGRIYFHSARDGEKIDDIKRDGRVCFEADLPVAFQRAKDQPCQAGYLYRSVVAKGRARIVWDETERMAAFGLLMEKYQPEGGFGGYLPEKLARTEIVRIDVEEMAGKENLGKGGVREQAEEILKEVLLPERKIDRS